MTTESSFGVNRRVKGFRTTIMRMALFTSDMSRDISMRVKERSSRSMYRVPW